MLVPRRAAAGGPFLRYECPGCGRPVHVERNRAGALLGAPPPIVPVADALLATFDADLRRELVAKREHERRRAGRRAWFFGPYADELLERRWRPAAPAAGVGGSEGAEREARERRPPDGRRSRRPPGRGPASAGAGPGPGASAGAGPGPGASAGPAAGASPPSSEPPPAPAAAAAPPTPHELLGVAPGAPPEAVNAAFRELARRYHPDRFATLDDEFQALATRRMQQLMAARAAMLPPVERGPPSA